MCLGCFALIKLLKLSIDAGLAHMAQRAMGGKSKPQDERDGDGGEACGEEVRKEVSWACACRYLGSSAMSSLPSQSPLPPDRAMLIVSSREFT